MNAFWGLQVEAGKTYTQVVDQDFRVTMAALGEKLVLGKRTCLKVTIEDESYFLCSLTPEKLEQQPLDIMFSEGEEITFSVEGENSIFLTGNYVIMEYPGEGHMDDDEEIYSDEELSGDDGDMVVGRAGIESEAGLLSDAEADFSSDNEDSNGRIHVLEEVEEVPELVVKSNKRKVDQVSPQKESKKSKAAGAEEIKTVHKKVEDVTAVAAEKVEDVAKEKPLSKTQMKKLARQKKLAEIATSKDGADAEMKEVPEVKVAAKKEQAKVVEKKEQAKAVPAETEEVKKNDDGKPSKKTLPSGLVIEDHKAGDGPRAKNGKKLSMRYVGKLKNGTKFDENTAGKPFEFTLGKNEVIKGWDIGLQGMQVGGVRRLIVPAKLAYGAQGAPPDIPKNADLIFDVKLLAVK